MAIIRNREFKVMGKIASNDGGNNKRRKKNIRQ
jgi:hypothetical protein